MSKGKNFTKTENFTPIDKEIRLEIGLEKMTETDLFLKF